MRLVQNGKPRRLSGVEIQAIAKEAMDASKAKRAAESEAHAAEQAAWRKSEARRRRFWNGVFYAVALIGTGSLVWFLKTETQAIVALLVSLILVGLSIRYAR